MSSLLDLPDDANLFMFKFLSFIEQIRIGRVCTTLYQLTIHPVLFEELTFDGLDGTNHSITSSQLTDFIINRLLHVEYVFTVDFMRIQHCERITEKNLRYLLVKCPFSKNIRHLKLHTCNDEKTVQVIAKYCPSLRKLEINHMNIVSNIFKQVANRCPHITYLSINMCSKLQEPFESSYQVIEDAMKMYATSNQTFELLHLSHCHITERTIKQLLMNSQQQKHRLTPVTYNTTNSLVSYRHEQARVILLRNLAFNLCRVTIQSLRDIGDHSEQFMEELEFSGNHASLYEYSKKATYEIPNNLAKLSLLRRLDLSGNNFKSFEKAKWSNLKQLTDLDLSHNDLEKFPDEALQFSNLRNLNLSYNNITVVPASIEALKLLHILNLSHNVLLVQIPRHELELMNNLLDVKLDGCVKVIQKVRPVLANTSSTRKSILSSVKRLFHSHF
jgi:hypothetical protein